MWEWTEAAFSLLGAISLILLLAEFLAVLNKRDRDAEMAREAFMRMIKKDDDGS